MESRWYLHPGQTLESTRIEDRGIALHCTAEGWKKFTKHLDRNRLAQEAKDKEIARKKALKEGSQEMTKNWENSVENIRKRKEEERIARLEKDESFKMERFYTLRKEQAVIKQQYVDEAQKAAYITTGDAKNLTSGLIAAEVYYERERQLELEKKIRDHEDEERAKFAAEVKYNAEQEKLENLEKAKKICQTKKEIGKLYMEEINAHAAYNRAQKEQKIKDEKEDTVNAQKEAEKMKQFKDAEALEQKKLIEKELEDFDKEQKHYQKILELQEKEQDNVIDIYLKAKHDITCLRKKKELELRNALQRKQAIAAKQVIAERLAKGDNEERILQKALDERDEEERKRLQKDEEFRLKLIKDRQEDRENFLEKERLRLEREKEVNKWEMINRFKINAVIKESELNKKKKRWEEILLYRKMLLEQMAENDKVKQAEIEEEEALYRQNIAKNSEIDRKFFEYADEVSKTVKNKGRSTIPIEKVVMEYNKKYNLPMDTTKKRK